MNKHRICLLCNRLTPPFDEGFKNLSLSLVRELSRDHDVLALTTSGEGSLELRVRRVRAGRSLLSIPLWRAIRAFRPEIIYYVPTASYTLFSFLRARVLGLYGRGAKVQMIAPQPRPLGTLARAIIPRVCPDFVWVQSPQSEKSLAELGCRVGLLSSGVDLDRFRPISREAKEALRRRHGLSSDAYIVTHVGHVNRNRNAHVLARLQREADCQVILAGSTSTPQDQRLAGELEAAGVRVLATYLPEIQEIYQLSDCYCFPVHAESGCIEMPLSVLEAMACDLKVVTTRYGVLPWRFAQGDGLFYADDDDALVACLRAAREEPPADTRRMVEPFSWQRVTRDMLCQAMGEEAHCREDD